MSLKSKKKLTFCTAEKGNSLILMNIDEKYVYAQILNQHFNFHINLTLITTREEIAVPYLQRQWIV